MSVLYPRVLPVGDRAVTVQLGNSLDEETVGRVRALDVRVKERAWAGILETVPTYAALMVLYDNRVLNFASLSRGLLEQAHDLGATASEGRLIEIPVVYDGADLDEVAASRGISRDEVIDRHSARDYSVLMLGFSPGFAYMGFVDDALRVPRRKTPRTRVPAGSVAIAGPQTGVYPRSLPGGWNLLGRTAVSLFDPTLSADNEGARGPSLLMPGDQVRFVPTQSLTPIEPAPRTRYTGGDVQVEDAGLLSTVQDAGRFGLRRLAVPWTGYADSVAARLANRCVGNAAGAPLIEICGPGLRLTFAQPTFIALTGAEVTGHLERVDLPVGRMALPMNVAVRVRPSNVLSILAVAGARAYVAIAGLVAPRILDSASTDLGSGFGRPLEAGDGFSVDRFDSDRASREPIQAKALSAEIRMVLGPQLEHFDQTAIDLFFATSWRVGLDSDRVGARLDGPRLSHAGPTEIVSDGMVPGCIQVPPDGRPIVMLSDCPTTGGYPKIGCVISEDLWVLAQAVPTKTTFRFVVVSV